MSLEKKWYVIRVANGKENKLKNGIFQELQRLGYGEHIEDAIVPTEKIPEIRNGKKVIKESVIMTGYVFLKIDLSGEVVHVIRNMSGVSGFLGETKGGDPAPLKDAEVARMLGGVDSEVEKIDEVEIPFEVGETVRLKNGAFANFDGVIEQIQKEKRMLKLSVKMFGKPTSVEVEYTDVEKI